MELRTTVDISSTWEPSAPLHGVLYLSNLSGNVLEEPVQSERCTSLVLSQVVGEEGGAAGCFLHIRRLAGLRGYTLCGVGLMSGARVMEVYSGDEYIATSKGALSDQDNQAGKCYECCLDFHRDQSCVGDHLALKLLSLRGKTAVPVTRLTLTLAEDHGGGETILNRDTSQNKRADLQELVGSLSLPSTAPPFLQGLVSSLHQWQQSGNTPPAANPHSSSEKPAPLDLLQMMSALRQIKPASSDVPKSDSLALHGEATGGAEPLVPDPTPSSIEAFVEQKLGELEERLRSYVDAKVAEIMELIEVKLERNRDTEMQVGINGDREHNTTIHSESNLEEKLN